jgi:hypothetical protein
VKVKLLGVLQSGVMAGQRLDEERGEVEEQTIRLSSDVVTKVSFSAFPCSFELNFSSLHPLKAAFGGLLKPSGRKIILQKIVHPLSHVRFFNLCGR